MAHRQLIGHHQHIAGLFGRVYAPIMVSSQQFLRSETRFINAVEQSHLVTQPDRGNEWPGTPRPACGIEYPLLATAKSTSETVFQIGLRMHRRGESECSEQEHDSFHGRSLASETPASYPKQASHISDQSRFPLALPHRTMLMAPPWPRSEEHTSELQSLMRISYAVFCLKKKKPTN